MAQVPINGNIEMFDGPNSIYKVIESEFVGAPADTTFDDILTFVKTYCDINNFHPAFRPATLNDVNQTRHFRGFPIKSHVTWYMDERTDVFIPV